MNLTHTSAALLLCTVLQCGCIKQEPLNAECDILSANLSDDLLNRAPDIRNDKVIFVIRPGVDVTKLAPTFVLTPGATIEPPSGTERDFSTPQTYVVTSENGEWHKTYTVEVDDNANLTLNYNFDKANLVNGYYQFYETDAEGNVTLTWASANPAFVLTGQGKTPEDFPTYMADNGQGSHCVALTTRSTGAFGAMFKKPIAAGNIFIGRFDTGIATTKPLEGTQFGGKPFYDIPLYLQGRYRYTPGEVYQELNDKGKLEDVPGMVDECNLYSVLYEVTPEMEWLDGTNVLSEDNPNIVAIAQFTPEMRQATDGWTDFKISYKYRKELDPQKLLEGKYSITIVASSSVNGDYFAGAIGSTMEVDLLQMLCLSDYVK